MSALALTRTLEESAVNLIIKLKGLVDRIPNKVSASFRTGKLAPTIGHIQSIKDSCNF